MPPRPRPSKRSAARPSTGGARQRKGQSVPEGRGQARVRPVAVQSDGSENASSEDAMASSDKSGVRLQKFMAAAGVDSRRNCEEYIRTGRVTIDGDVIIDPAINVDPETQDIRLDGERLRMPRFRYYLLNKPKGVLCTNSDPQGRPRAIDLIPSQGQRLFTVGRLDESTEGLLLITNDGDLAERLAHPRFEVVRRYRCQVAGIPADTTLQQLREGMYFSDGFFRFRGVRILKRKGRSVMLELELREGKNREIRRLLAKVGHKVISLERIAFGPLRLGYLSPGKHRELKPGEVLELRRALVEMEHQGRNVDSNRRPRPRKPQKEEAAQAVVPDSHKSRTPQEVRRESAGGSKRPQTSSSSSVQAGRSSEGVARHAVGTERQAGARQAGAASAERRPSARRPAKPSAIKGKPAKKVRPINKGRDRRRER